MASESKRIGVLVGREWSWPPAFIDEVNKRDTGVVAEYVKLGGTRMNEANLYAVIVDRISQEIPYYRTYLKNAVLQGTIVVNNPFWSSADDKFFGACLLDRLGIQHARTVVLPSHSYIDGVVTESLRNLTYPVPWEEHIAYLGGFPLILKPAWGGGFKQVFKIHNLQELWTAYNETGIECMVLQQFIDWDNYARCLCIGQQDVLPIKFDVNRPWPHRYVVDDKFLSPELHDLIVKWAIQINRALGYDMNACEFAVKDGVPYAIDFTNPVPDFEVTSLTDHYFPFVVQKMADLCIDLALGRRQRAQTRPQWDALIYA
jgi:glutathione synthase/RimK-type ligase-like ATP-grasp enzyme